MKYRILNGDIIIEDLKDFNPKHTLECGQVFRYHKTDSGYKIFSQNLFCSLIYDECRVIMRSNNTDYFVNYFDLNTDYSVIKDSLSKFPELKNAVDFGSGIRILKQEPLEVLFSFIISANNNIPRIQGSIEKIAVAIGENRGDYYSFPSLQAISSKDATFFRSMGLGYRAEYVVKTAEMLNAGFSLNLQGMSTEEARKHLMRLQGIGPKVADCILLFGYNRQDSFPTDVWIEKVYNKIFGEDKLPRTKKSARLAERYGKMSGYAQQYLFYYARENNNKINLIMEEKQ